MTDKLDLSILRTGIPGLDDITGGGLPELSFNIIGGPPGSGKTTIAQQIMFTLASPKCKALFFTALGEPPVKMLRYQQQFTFFDFDKVDTSIKFINLAAEIQGGNYDTVLATITKEVQTYSPSLIFIDSFRSVIQEVSGTEREPCHLQSFVQQLAMCLTGWQATTFLIGEYQPNEMDQNPIFTIADGVLWLTQNVYRNAMVRKIQVTKMRGLEQRPGVHTFRITKSGVEIFPRVMAAPANTGGKSYKVSAKNRCSMGVPALDEMLGGGLPIGYSMLLVGPSGSGKSLLATEFLAEAVRQNEPAVIALFEKMPEQMMCDKLDAMVNSGQVGMINMRSLDLSVDAILSELILMIERMNAKRVVFDSLSGFELALAPEFREEFRESLYRMVTVLNAKGVTLLMTTELEDRFTELRFSPYGSAFLTDAIVMQRYIESEGQLKTIISVVKVRGSRHSRDIRLFEVTDDGVAIGATPALYEGMLSGTSRHR